MNRYFLAAVVAVIGALAIAATSALASPPKLNGTVGPGFTITLTQNGKKVKTLKAGTYTFVINDKASSHSFSLDGPNGFTKAFTSVPFVGTKTFTVKLAKGTYTYYCVPHKSFMFGTFTVT